MSSAARLILHTCTLRNAYDGIHCVADLALDGTLLRSYTWGTGIDNLLAVTLYGGGATNTLYAVTDPPGTVHALVDADGAVAVAYAYDSWGNLLSVSGDETLASLRFTWQGREYSRATALYSFRARWYDPASGRWLSKDPIGLEGGLNLYEAFGSNPVCFVDPCGKVIINDGDKYLETIREIIAPANKLDALNISSIYKMVMAGTLHGGCWSPFDTKVNVEENELFRVSDEQKMKREEFGNFLAGYTAGYSLDISVYIGIRLGGIIYAVGDNICSKILRMEDLSPEGLFDGDSVPAIHKGVMRGVRDRLRGYK